MRLCIISNQKIEFSNLNFSGLKPKNLNRMKNPNPIKNLIFLGFKPLLKYNQILRKNEKQLTEIPKFSKWALF